MKVINNSFVDVGLFTKRAQRKLQWQPYVYIPDFQYNAEIKEKLKEMF